MYPAINLVNAIFDRDVQHVPFHFHSQQHMLSVQSESFEMQIPLFEWSGDILIAPGYWQIIQHYCSRSTLSSGWLIEETFGDMWHIFHLKKLNFFIIALNQVAY